MSNTDPHVIGSMEQLRQLYDVPPLPIITESKLDFVHKHMAHFIELAPFVCVSSQGDEGIDVSPRGGAPGFVKVLDARTVAFGDWPGNNKLESFSNILQSGRCGLLFLIPKLTLFLRINGQAVLTCAPDLLEKLGERGKVPKMAVKVTVKEAYYHCGKAFIRSGLWKPDQWRDVSGYPSVGRFMSDVVGVTEFTPEIINEMYDQDLKERLY